MSNRSPDPVDVTIGLRIASRRKQCGLNQSELGKAIGVTFQQVQKYEKGSNRVSGSKLYRIAATLGVEPAYFFPAKGEIADKAATASDQLGATRGGHELARLYVQMRPDCRESVLSVARSMVGLTAGQLRDLATA